jgi:hypothetical protein
MPGTPSPTQNQPDSAEQGRITDAFVKGDKLTYEGYVIQRRNKKVKLDYPWEMKAPPLWVEVSYAVITRKRRFIAKFDGGIYFGAGNSTRFGLLSFLGDKTKQLVVSQDISRGGTQWVASLVPRFHLIFDGPAFHVGREADDMGIIDLDGDGVYEITVPITDFYELQDKLSISQIPLPEIIFKYDPLKRKYLPANPLFPRYLLNGIGTLEGDVSGNDQFAIRSAVLDKLLTYIYVGREREAWAFYARAYTLDDREEIKRRVKSILRKQPVYKFIYNHAYYK